MLKAKQIWLAFGFILGLVPGMNSYVFSNDFVDIPPNFYFNQKVSAFAGLKTSGMNYSVEMVFFNRVAIGGSFGTHRYTYRLFSASDVHKIHLRYKPFQASTTVFIGSYGKLNPYIYGMYGKSLSTNQDDNIYDKEFPTPTYEFGVGMRIPGDKYSFDLFLGQCFAQGKGTLYSTYNSVIDYELKINTIKAGIAMNFPLGRNRYSAL